MKYFALFLCCLSCFAMADENLIKEQNPSHKHTYSEIGARFGYFFFSSTKMRQVYDRGGLNVQFSFVHRLFDQLRLYSSCDYLQRSGHSLGGHQPTSIWEIPLSLGLQPFFPSEKFSYYFTLGPRYVFAHVKNQSDFVDRSLNQNGFGGFANVGMVYSFSKFAIDFFGEYFYCKMRFHHSHPATQTHMVQVGGLTFGAGLGRIF